MGTHGDTQRGDDARAMRQLRGITRTPRRTSVPPALPLTQTGWAVVLILCGLLITFAAVTVLASR